MVEYAKPNHWLVKVRLVPNSRTYIGLLCLKFWIKMLLIPIHSSCQPWFYQGIKLTLVSMTNPTSRWPQSTPDGSIIVGRFRPEQSEYGHYYSMCKEVSRIRRRLCDKCFPLSNGNLFCGTSGEFKNSIVYATKIYRWIWKFIFFLFLLTFANSLMFL